MKSFVRSRVISLDALYWYIDCEVRVKSFVRSRVISLDALYWYIDCEVREVVR